METCLSRTRKLSTLDYLATANIWSRALQIEVELQNKCLQLEKLKSTNSSLQADLVELQQELDNFCSKTKVTTEKVFGKWSADCEALRDNLKAATGEIH